MDEYPHNEIMRALGRLEGKVEEGFKSINQRLGSVDEVLKKHDGEIDGFKTDMASMKTKASLFGAGAGFSVMILWEVIKNKFFK